MSGVYADRQVASVSAGLDRQRIEQVLVLDGSTSAALASLLAGLEDIREAPNVPLAPNQYEALVNLRAQAYRCGSQQ